MDRRSLFYFMCQCWTQSNIANQESAANIICTDTKKTHEEPQQPQQQCTLVTSITGVLSTCCGETSLCPQCCCTQQIGMLGCKKTIWFIVEFVQTRWTLFVGCECRYPCTSLHGRGTRQQSQSSWLLIPFFDFFGQRLVCSCKPNRSPQSERASLLASLVALRLLLAFEDVVCSLRSSSWSNVQ